MKCQNCGVDFEPTAHNQKFHSPECLRESTNRRVREKYHEDKDRLKGKQRFCKNGCGTVLSRYNSESVCHYCKAEIVKQRKRDFLEALGVIRPKKDAR